MKETTIKEEIRNYEGLIIRYIQTFYAEKSKGKYVKIKYKDPCDAICDLKEADEAVQEDFEKYITLGQDLYICDKNKKRVAVYRALGTKNKRPYIPAVKKVGGKWQYCEYSFMEVLEQEE